MNNRVNHDDSNTFAKHNFDHSKTITCQSVGLSAQSESHDCGWRQIVDFFVYILHFFFTHKHYLLTLSYVELKEVQ